MRIALVVHKFPPASIGGTEVYAYRLAKALSQRYEVAVFYRDDNSETSLKHSEDQEAFQRWQVRRSLDIQRAGPVTLFWDTFFNPDIESSYERFLDTFQPEIVHFHHLMTLSFRLVARTRRRGIPCLLTLHDYWFICANSQLIWPDARTCTGKACGLNCARCAIARLGKPWLLLACPLIAPFFRLRDYLVRDAALQANLLIAPSRFLINCYLAEGFPPERFYLLENGVDVERIRYTYRRNRASDGKLCVTYLGALAWQKGVHILIEAFRGLPSDRAVLRVYGDPNLFPEYATQLRQMADPTNTLFEGPAPNEQVGKVLAETDVLAVPSLWYENSPVVIQEARAAGVPVIASAHGALAEKVQNGIDGLLVPPADIFAWRAVLQRLINEPNLLARLRAGVRPPMTIEEHVDRLEALYAEILDRDPRRSKMNPA